jgi:LysM repeat protein
MSVGQGETLWTLARRYGNPSASQLDRVDALAKANGLSASAMLHPGQRLIVPVENPYEAERLQTVMAAR